ncbi:hypothetical protein JKF63_06381 [Porcisia hertigi]|uniref:non-specific serine/threonine protein kinase n=1 Tax=Porcisia hertigi TaxID=2761500 RepID=A0A836LJU3_9TRYP|nr:hypothetical protein JKF63_06381 [Porcisia hertigi]
MAVSEYKIMERMATGSFGIVFKVRRVTDQQVFVMKRIPLLGLTPSQRRDAAQEIVVMRDLHHPCVVSHRDAFLFNEHDLCLVMDYYDGGDMDTRMAEQRELDMYFELDQVMLWFVQLVLGVQYLHAHNVVHRDIKTHNVFVRSKDMSVVLGDFGISERLDTEPASRTWLGSATMGDRRVRSSSSVQSVSAMIIPNPVDSSSSANPSVSHPHTPRGETEAGAASPSPLLEQQATWASGQWGPESLLNSAQTSPRHLSSSSYAASSCPPGTTQRRSHGGFDGFGVMEAAMKGTPLYMAPEVLQGKAASRKSDVWSLGCVLYELLALRHPFESRDLAPLVVRVLRGQREPLPSHYPRPISELINRMLCLDAGQRPSCEEVLMVPCVRAYVDLWRSLRTPLDVPSSPGESALMRQLHAWQANVTALNARYPDDPRGKSLHYTELKRQLQRPSCAPAEERENVERRVIEAARTALLSGQASGVADSAFSYGIGASSHGGGSVQDGTFFYGASGRRLTGVADSVGGAQRSTHSAGEGIAGVVPSESMRLNTFHGTALEPGVVAAARGAGQSGADAPADEALGRPPPRPPRHRLESPPPLQVEAVAQAVTGEKCGVGGNHPRSVPRPSDAVPFEESPMMSVIMGKHQHQQVSEHQSTVPQQGDKPVRHDGRTVPRRKPSQGTAALAIDVVEVTPKNTPLRSSPSRPRPRSSFSASPPPSVPHEHRIFPGNVTDDDALFFQAYGNVADMRFASLEEIYQTVTELRQRVQHLMRHQRVLTDIETLHQEYGSPVLRSMPHILQVLEVAAAVKDSAEVPEGASARAQPSTLPEDVFLRMVQQIDQQRFKREQLYSDAGNGEWVNDILHAKHLPVRLPVSAARGEEGPRHARAPMGNAKSSATPSLSSSLFPVPAVSPQFADPAAPLMAASTRGAHSPSSAPTRELQRCRRYVDRRNHLSAALTSVFDVTTLRAVYTYYRSCPLLQRDPAVVRRLVPDRRRWTELPSIEELGVLDRQLEVMFKE